MITKKKTKTVKDKPMISEKTYAEQIGYFTMVLEGMRYDMKGFGEQLAATRIEFFEKLDATKQELKTEIQFTQQALKTVNTDLRSEINRVEQNLTSEIRQVGKSVEKHDEDIVFLKTAMMKEHT